MELVGLITTTTPDAVMAISFVALAKKLRQNMDLNPRKAANFGHSDLLARCEQKILAGIPCAKVRILGKETEGKMNFFRFEQIDPTGFPVTISRLCTDVFHKIKKKKGTDIS